MFTARVHARQQHNSLGISTGSFSIQYGFQQAGALLASTPAAAVFTVEEARRRCSHVDTALAAMEAMEAMEAMGPGQQWSEREQLTVAVLFERVRLQVRRWRVYRGPPSQCGWGVAAQCTASPPHTPAASLLCSSTLASASSSPS